MKMNLAASDESKVEGEGGERRAEIQGGRWGSGSRADINDSHSNERC
jgi:hypothetical protein